MIVTLSGIGEQRIKRFIAVCPCHIGDGPLIGHSAAAAEDIVESDDRRRRRSLGEAYRVETGLSGFCDYYVIGQFSLCAISFGVDAGTMGGVVVSDRVIDEYRPTDADGYPPVNTTALTTLIAGDEILDDQRFWIIHRGSSQAEPQSASKKGRIL